MDNADKIIDLYKSPLSENELLSRIGENDPDHLGFAPSDIESKLRHGRQWWDSRAEKIRQLVCPLLKQHDASTVIAKDVVQLICASLGAQYGLGIATYVAAYALRKYAEGWCS